MVDPYVAEIRIMGFNFAPRGWAQCNGQLMPLSQNTALFSLLGTMYGGDGKSTFALPDLQGRSPMMWGQGPGLTDRVQGESGGSQTVTLLESEMPNHTHVVNASTFDANSANPAANALGITSGGTPYSGNAPNTQMDPQALAVTGGSLPHNNMQPYLGFNFCIALQGVFPPRT